MLPRCQIIAHRGFSGLHPENTLAAVRAALRLGVDWIEIDVQQTRDRHLVVFHDYQLQRLCGRPGRIDQVSRAQLHRLNPAVPSLRQVLRLCRGRARVLLEIKRADPELVARAILAARMEARVLVFSFNWRCLQRLAAVAPRIHRFGLVADRVPSLSPVPIQGIAVPQRLVRSAALVRRVHQRGWQLFVWTVNRRSAMRRLADWGVNGLITNRPDWAKSVLARSGSCAILPPCSRSSSARSAPRNWPPCRARSRSS